MARITHKTGSLYQISGIQSGGRRAGAGIVYDDYSEESGNREYQDNTPVRFPHDGVNPEELNGPVICYKAGRGADNG